MTSEMGGSDWRDANWLELSGARRGSEEEIMLGVGYEAEVRGW